MILDNGEDTIFLEDSKFDKTMESIQVTADPSEVADGEHSDGSSIELNDNEEKVEKTTDREEDIERLELPECWKKTRKYREII